MINGKSIAVVLPAYNAANTIEKTVAQIPRDYVDSIFVVDDASSDFTVDIASTLNVYVHKHRENLGYGGNQKTCYDLALNSGADVIVMLHPDYQYDPRLLVAIAAPICFAVYDVVLGSRILGGDALQGGMPIAKYLANRLLTAYQNVAYGCKLSEYHTGYRAYSREALKKLNYKNAGNDFRFDAEILDQIINLRMRIGEISCPTRYLPDSSSISFVPGVKYAYRCIELATRTALSRALSLIKLPRL